MKYDFLNGKSTDVYFCLGCDDQAPWIATVVKPCPTCGITDDVTIAQRFQNLTSEETGKVRYVD